MSSLYTGLCWAVMSSAWRDMVTWLQWSDQKSMEDDWSHVFLHVFFAIETWNSPLPWYINDQNSIVQDEKRLMASTVDHPVGEFGRFQAWIANVGTFRWCRLKPWFPSYKVCVTVRTMNDIDTYIDYFVHSTQCERAREREREKQKTQEKKSLGWIPQFFDPNVWP